MEMPNIISLRSVFDPWFLLTHFGDWVDAAAEHLLTSATDTSDALLWLLAFYYTPYNGCNSRTETLLEARVVADRLRSIVGKVNLSSHVLGDAVRLKTGACHPGTIQLIRHLTISFLLFSSNGPKIAKEYITQMTQTEAEASDVSNILAQAARRLRIPGLKNERTMELAQNLLQEIRSGTKDV